MLYFGSVNSNLYAWHAPTVLARSSWPGFRGNLRHTGNAVGLLLRPESFTASNMLFYVTGLPGSSNVVQSSSDLTNWTTFATTNLPVSGTLLISNACSNCFYRVKSLDGAVQSLNALGHLNVNANTGYGYTMLANQLNNPAGNAVASLLPSPFPGTIVFKWNDATQVYATNRFSFGSWTDPNMTLNPGEGVFYYNPSNATATLTFVGEVPQGYRVNSFVTNCIRGSMVPQSGPLDSLLGYPVIEGDTIYRYNPVSGAYDCHQYVMGAWECDSVFAPVPAVGESYWITTGTARNWTRRFSVWP